jgi:hypothetical protein
MNEFWKKLEYYNSKLIPSAIVVLVFLIIVELFFQDFAEYYHILISVLDWFVVVVFVIDLTFLAIHARSTVYFFKHYWLDIVAIFPLVIALNLLSKLYKVFAVSGKVVLGQAIVYESLEAKKGFRALTRAGKFAKWFRIVARSIRLITKSRIFAQFHAKHHLAKRNLDKGINQREDEKQKAKKLKGKKLPKKKKGIVHKSGKKKVWRKFNKSNR